MKQIIISLIAAFIASGTALAEIRTITVSNAIDLALQNNLALKQSEQDLAIAKAQYDQSFADFALPKVGITGSYTILDPDTVSNGNFMLMQPSGYVALNKGAAPVYPVVPTGIVAFTNYYQDNYSASIGITKPIFAGFRLWNSLKMREINLDLAKKKYEDKKKEISYNTMTSFYNLFLQKENISLYEEQNKSLSNQVKNILLNYEIGSASEYDKTRVIVLYKSNQPKLLSARNAYKTSQISFCDYIGIKDYDQVEFVGALLDCTNLTLTNLDEAVSIEKALSNDINLKAMDYNLVLQKYSREINDASKYPTLSAFLNFKEEYGKEMITNTERSLVSSWNTGLQLSVPIDDWFPFSKTANTVKEADANIQKTSEARQQLVENLTLQVRSLLMQLEVAKINVSSQQDSLNQAKLGLEIANNRYSAGASLFLEIIDSETSYAQAQAGYLQSIYDYYSDILKLKRLIED